MNLKDDQDLKRHIGEGGNVNINVDEELAALEAEVLEEKKKKGKKDELNEEEKKTQSQKIPTQLKTKPQQNPQQKKEIPKGKDLFPEKTEKMYHNVEKMISVGVLEKEKILCDKIIEYKIIIGAGYDHLKKKKDTIDTRIDNISSFVSCGEWDVNKYKHEIISQYKWEVKLSQFVEKDPILNDQQKKFVKDRIKARKKIIEAELKEKVEEEEPKKEEPQKDSSSLYPEKTEKKYHNVEKITSIGCLERERELCNKIIEYKKKNDEDYEYWNMKKKDIDSKISSVSSYISKGIWGKKNIKYY